jgi:chemotaxis protein CheD
MIMKGKYADTGIKELIDQMVAAGACRTNLVAKMAGGAQMFEVKEGSDTLSIGDKNVEAAKAVLAANNIRLVAEDTGADYGRTIELNLDDGSLVVRTVTQEIKNI